MVPEVPIRLGDVLQTGIVVKDLQASMEHYWRTLGIGPWKVYTYAPPTLREAMVRGRAVEYAIRIAHAHAGSVQLELIQPLAGPSIFAEYLEMKGEGLHHIQSRTEDIEGALRPSGRSASGS
jgi:4-hydroxyphenylpyruvate dioxygenase-like putative hemolysin